MSLPVRIDELQTPAQASVTVSAGAVMAIVTGGKTVQIPLDDVIDTASSFLQSGTGAVARSVQEELREQVSITQFMSAAQKADAAAGTVAVDISSAVVLALAAFPGGNFRLPSGTYRFDSSVELNDQTSADVSAYRMAPKILGDGIRRTRILNRANGPAFKYTLLQGQGDVNSFGQGLEIGGLEIFGDGSSPAGSIGISLEGAYFPYIHDVLITAMGSHGFTTPVDARFANPDRYSCADISMDRVTISACGGWGIRNEGFATVYKVHDCYVSSNVGGGIYLEGSVHDIEGGAVAGNGAVADANSCGIKLARTSSGTPQNCNIRKCEIDNNWNRQIILQSLNTQVERCRIIDAVVAGAFRSNVQIEVVGLSGTSADSNRIENNLFRFDNQAAVNVTAIQFNLDVTDGTRTCRYNIAEANTYTANGVTSGVVTEVDMVNLNNQWATGNKNYSVTRPKGYAFSGSFTRDISLASGTQAITGLGFRPGAILFRASVTGTERASWGDSDGGLVDRVTYRYSVVPSYETSDTASIDIRTAAGDEYVGQVSSYDPDGFTITWTKGGTPTGTVTVKYLAINT